MSIIERDNGTWKVIKLEEMKPMSIFQRLILYFGGTAVQYTMKCGGCGNPTKGNIITGFHKDCGHN